MSTKIEHIVSVESYDSIEKLNQIDQTLLGKAKEASKKAYAIYSKFNVGAAVLLDSGEIFLGNNQENIAYPSGMCAERVAMYHTFATFPDNKVKTIAVYAHSNEFEVINPVTPCGACRQVIAEYEQKQGDKIRIIMSGEKGDIFIVESIKELLPFAFNEAGLIKE